MKAMVERFGNEVKTKGTTDENRLYDDICVNLGKEAPGKVDIEAIFTIVEGLKKADQESLGKFSLYASQAIFGRSLQEIKGRYNANVLAGLMQRLHEFIQRECSLKSSARPKMRDVLSDFFNQIGFAGKIPDSFHGTAANNNWTLFTTNYDRCLEAFWREDVGVNLNTGFVPNGPRNEQQPDSYIIPAGGIQLIKLHGSTTWLRRRETGKIEEKDYNLLQAFELGMGLQYQEEVMIYPLARKQIYLEPYVQMFFRLGKELRKQSKWVVVGYSFGDPVIRDLFVENGDPSKKLVLIHPRAEEIVKAELSECDATMRPLPEKFGENNTLNGKEWDFKEVNRHIVEALSN